MSVVMLALSFYIPVTFTSKQRLLHQCSCICM